MGNPWGKDVPFTAEEQEGNKAHVRAALRSMIAERCPERAAYFEQHIPLLANEAV